MKISNYALKNRPAVYVLVFLFVLIGLRSYVTLPRESSPDVNIPYIVVVTSWYGTSPEDMEKLVTNKIEQELGEINELQEMTSSSMDGLSQIFLEFDIDADIDEMMAKVRDKVDLARPELPSDAEEPLIQEISFDDFPIISVNLTADYDLAQLKTVAENLQDEFEQIEGVLDVVISGGLEREVQINVDPDRLRHYRLNIEDVQMAILNENFNMPGGEMDLGDYSFLLRVPGEVSDPHEIEDFVVKADDHFPVYIRDVATVSVGYKDLTSTARLEGQNCITLDISKKAGENLIRICDRAHEIVDEQLPNLPPTTRVTFTGDQSKDIRMMVDDLQNGVLNGLVLVILVLVFFMGFRTSLFVAAAIPLSMLISFWVLQVFGHTLNMVVLFSLILALGMLVDNAIVVVENIYRFMEEGHSPSSAAVKGVGEVAWAVTASTATTLCAFIPMLGWPGIVGEFMSFLPITLIITLTASLFVALIVNPVFCASLLKVRRKDTTGPQRSAFEQSWLARKYHGVITWALDHRLSVILLAFVSLVGMIALYGAFGRGLEFFPDTDPRLVTISFEQPSGTRLERTDEYLQSVEGRLHDWPNVRTYVARAGVGGDIFSGGGNPSHKGRITVDMIDRQYRDRSTNETMASIRETITSEPGTIITVEKQEEGPPTGKPVNIEIHGDDYLMLGTLTDQVMKTVRDTPGLVNLQSNYDSGKPEIQVVIDRDRAAYLGLSTGMIASAVRGAFNGLETGTWREGDDDVDITVRFAPEARTTIEDIENVHLVIEGGDMVPLSSVADVVMTTGFGTITHIDEDRVITISGDVEGRLDNEVLLEVQQRLADFELPHGYKMEFTGASEDQEEASEFLEGAFLMAVFLIAMVLVLQFNSVTTPLVIIVSVMLSLIGVFMGLLIMHKPFGIVMTGVGVISLAGVVVNNAIVLLDYTIKLRNRGLNKREALIKAGVTRLRPVLLTAITTILGLVPMATGINYQFTDFRWVTESDSSQFWSSMAAAVIFGLAVATVLTLVVVPVMYSLIDSFNVRCNRIFGRFINPNEGSAHARMAQLSHDDV